MIAKSDLVILTLSTAALAVGIVRWQHATTVVPSMTVPASARQAAPVPTPTAPSVTTLPSRAEATPAPENRSVPVVRRLDETEEVIPVVVQTPATAAIDDAPAVAAVPEYGVYRVRSGDFLGRIAQRYDTSVARLREINGISGSTIRIGQSIRYPLPDSGGALTAP